MRLFGLTVMGTLCLAASAQAFEPMAGDFVVYVNENGSGESFTKKKVDSVSGDGSFRIGEYAIGRDPAKEELMFQYPVDADYLKSVYITDLKAFCESSQGSLGRVETRAGTLESCLVVVYVEDRKFADWYAAGVPFGVVKSHVSIIDGPDMITRDLVSFGRAER